MRRERHIDEINAIHPRLGTGDLPKVELTRMTHFMFGILQLHVGFFTICDGL